MKLGVESARTGEDVPPKHQTNKQSTDVMLPKRSASTAGVWLLLMDAPWRLFPLVVIFLVFDFFRWRHGPESVIPDTWHLTPETCT